MVALKEVAPTLSTGATPKTPPSQSVLRELVLRVTSETSNKGLKYIYMR